MGKIDRYEPTNEDIINLIHRMTGFNEDTIIEYIRIFKINKSGDLTIRDITEKQETLFFIERGLKIKKLIKKDNINLIEIKKNKIKVIKNL